LFYLFLLCTVVPFVEVAILIWIGRLTHWWVPIALSIVCGVLGVALARSQGWKAMRRIREEAEAGKAPAGPMIDRLMIFIAGLLLVVPGVLTDLVGFALLVPPLRSLVKRGVAAWMRRNVEMHVSRMGAPFHQRHDAIIDAKVIDTRVEDLR